MKKKLCSRCKQEKPATSEFFIRAKNAKDGFRHCKICQQHIGKHRKKPKNYVVPKSKPCPRCKQEKLCTKEFFVREPYNKTGFGYCKSCKKESGAISYLKHRDDILRKATESRKENLERHRKRAMNNYERHKNEFIARQLERRRSDPKLRINHSFSTRMKLSLKVGKGGKGWQKLVDYTLDDLVEHLEIQFTDGMSWDNYGRASEAEKWWSIDHVRPIVSFDYETYNDPQFRECWSLLNLQPMWFRENCSKNDKTG